MKWTMKAIAVDQAYSPALSQLADSLFWNWRRARVLVRVASGSREVLWKQASSPIPTRGCDIRLRVNKGKTIQARVVGVRGHDDTGWILSLSTAVLLDETTVRTSTADLSMFWRNTPLIQQLASRAYHSTNVPAVRAEVYLILGRTHHAHGELGKAVRYYSQACNLAPDLGLAHFRLAQAHAAMGKIWHTFPMS